jgi:hypothetical protein
MRIRTLITEVLVLLSALFCFGSLGFSASSADSAFLKDTYFPAVTLLYAQAEDGTMKMRCTATAYEKTETGYLFVSAAHCATVDDELVREKVDKAEFFITPDEDAEAKTFIRAMVVACGYQDKGDDFCIFFVKTSQTFPTVAMGRDSSAIVGEEIVNVSSPLGLGKQVFFGRVTMPRLDRSVVVDNFDWSHTVLLQLPGTNGGSSGSAVICLDQRAVCAFVVGTIGGSTVVGLPVSRFTDFREQVRTCQSKNYVVSASSPKGAFSYQCPVQEKKK